MAGWLKKKGFAKHADVSVRTVHDWMKQGLPYIRLGSGTILINVKDGDSWLKSFSVTDDDQALVNDILDGLNG